MSYHGLKLALLKRYNFTELGYRKRFREINPDVQENLGQFMVRLKNYFTKRVKLSKVEKSFDDLVELVVRKQFTNVCCKDLSLHLNERSRKTLDEMVILAEQHLKAHDKTLLSNYVEARRGALEEEKVQKVFVW